MVETSCILFRVIQLSPENGQTYTHRILWNFHKKSGIAIPHRTAVSVKYPPLSTFSRKNTGKEWGYGGDVTQKQKHYGKRKKPLYSGKTSAKNRDHRCFCWVLRTFPHFSQTFPQAKISFVFTRNPGAVNITLCDTLRQNINFFVVHHYAEQGFLVQKTGLDKNNLFIFQKNFFKMGLILWK